MTDIEEKFTTVGPSKKKEKKLQRVDKRDTRFVHNLAHQRGFQDGCTLITSFHQAEDEVVVECVNHPDRTYDLKRYHCMAKSLYKLVRASYQNLKESRAVAWEGAERTTKRTDTELFYLNYTSALTSAFLAYATQENRYATTEDAVVELRQIFEMVMRIHSAELRRQSRVGREVNDQTASWLVQWNKALR